MNIHVSNLSFNLIDADLRRMFSAFGEVNSAVIVRDKYNGRSKGTAFVDMNNSLQAAQAILGLHNSTVDGKRISVSEIEYDPTRYQN
jgi:RNA recognition motif-containing protein